MYTSQLHDCTTVSLKSQYHHLPQNRNSIMKILNAHEDRVCRKKWGFQNGENLAGKFAVESRQGGNISLECMAFSGKIYRFFKMRESNYFVDKCR